MPGAPRPLTGAMLLHPAFATDWRMIDPLMKITEQSHVRNNAEDTVSTQISHSPYARTGSE